MAPFPLRASRGVPCLGFLLVAGCAWVAPEERKWIEVRSPDFRILSLRSEADSLELARDLELFRSVAEFVLGEPIAPSRVPLLALAFDGPGSYRPFSIENALGYFHLSMRNSSRPSGPAGGSSPLP